MKKIIFSLNFKRLRVIVVTFVFSMFSQSWASNNSCTEVCNWYTTIFPLCESQDDQWGWENSASCIGRNICGNQSGDGGVQQRCEEQTEDRLCEQLDGGTYYSNHVALSGYDGENHTFSRRILRFSDGKYEINLNGNLPSALYPQAGTYSCADGRVIALTESDVEHDVEHSPDFSRVRISINGWSAAEEYRLKSEENADCSLVQSGTYSLDGAEGSEEAPSISFGIAPAEIEIMIPGEEFSFPNFDCESGSLLINRERGDDSPIEVDIHENGAAIVVNLNEDQNLRFVRDMSQACGDIDLPVCSIVPSAPSCNDYICASGKHSSFVNRCESDIAGANFLKKGDCGDLEGLPYYENTGTACSGEYNPVCAAKNYNIPCLSSPCPIQVYKTYSNQCALRNETFGASAIHLGECDTESRRVLDNSDKGLVCAAVYQPVCAKDEGGAACTTEPCNTHTYKTFGNLCQANVFVSDVVWEDADCGSLEGVHATQYPPAKMVDTLTEVAEKARIDSARIENDQLYVDLHFTGCREQNFQLEVANTFAESIPIQANWVLVPPTYQQCQAEIDVSFVYDLLPLKTLYEQQYGDGPATISLPGLVEYNINQ